MHHLEHLLGQYGYGLIFAVITLESMGAPLPGESLLIAASIYAATTQKMTIEWIIPVAATGAILGDNLGFALGWWLGYRALARFGRKVGLTEKRLRLGRYLFREHGGKVVFFGRFIAFLRTFAALLAGANHMPWRSFLVWNAAGGIIWCAGYGIAAYLLGTAATSLETPVAIGLGLLAAPVVIYAIVFLKRNESRLIAQAEAAAGSSEGDARQTGTPPVT